MRFIQEIAIAMQKDSLVTIRKQYVAPRVERVDFEVQRVYNSHPLEVERFNIVIEGDIPSSNVERMSIHTLWGDGEENRFF